MKSTTLQFLGKPVSVFEYGVSSNPALLFIHGNSSPSNFFKPLICLMEKNYRIITLDLPGHRNSGAWGKDDFTKETLSKLFNTVLDYYKITEVDAFGFSMGGLLLLECFDLMPAVRKIAVAGHPPLTSVAEMPEAYYLNEDTSLYLQGHLSEEEVERIYNAAVGINDKKIKGEIKQAILRTSPSFREGCLLIAQNVSNQITKLNQLKNPITIIHAEKDMAVQYEYLRKLQFENLWEQKIQIIRDSGHYMILEKPAELAQILHQFFSSK